MKATELIISLNDIIKEYGDLEIDIITEDLMKFQVEQELKDIAVSNFQKRIKLLPQNF